MDTIKNTDIDDDTEDDIKAKESPTREFMNNSERLDPEKDTSDEDYVEIFEIEKKDKDPNLFSSMRNSAKKFGSSIRSTAIEKLNASMKKNASEFGKAVSEKSMKYAKRWNAIRKANKNKNVYASERKITRQGVSQYRHGPIPLESLPSSDRCVARTSHGTLDSDEEDMIPCSPSSKGLLVYFRTLAKSTDENESVDLKFVDSLLEAGANINHEDRYGQTALHAIARDWHVDVVKYALEHGADINKADTFGRTPLHLAAAVDYHEMVEYLVLNNALIDAKTADGQTPLHFACKNSAVNSVKVLMNLGAQINERDNNLRTPLFVAAESGRADVVKILLDADSPAGVYDIHGNSAMAFMVEKMPAVAYEALAQFYVDDKALRRKFYYLNQLEAETNKKDKANDFAKTALEMIVIYKETDLVMHPVIQKMINVKWNLLLKKKSLIDLIVNLCYTIIWITLALLIPRDAKFYTPLSKKAWRIVLEVIFITLSVYFVIKEVRISRIGRKADLQWREWTVRNLENELEHCHPKWPDERKYIESEIKRVWKFNGTYSRNLFWSVYEWCCLISVFAVFSTQMYHWRVPESSAGWKAYSVLFSISIMMICLRLMRICRAFTFLSVFIVLLGHVVGATIKFAFLFFEFFIPYVCIIWLIFGGPENAAKIGKISGAATAEQFKKFDEIVFITWSMTVTADIPFGAMVNYRRDLASIIVGSYYALVSVVCINIYIALMSELFTRVYKKAEANASLQQALLIIFLEREMSARETQRIKRYFQKQCSPIEDVEYGKTKGRSLDLDTEINVALGNIDNDLIAVTESLEESEGKSKRPDNSEAKLIDELCKKSKDLLINQECLITQMKSSYDDVLKTQEGVTKSLHAIVKKVLHSDRRVQPTLHRSRSSNSLAY